MHDVVHAIEGPHELVAVTDGTPEKTLTLRLRMVEKPLLELVLLEFVSGEDHDTPRLVLVEQREEQPLAKGTGAAGDEDVRLGEWRSCGR